MMFVYVHRRTSRKVPCAGLYRFCESIGLVRKKRTTLFDRSYIDFLSQIKSDDKVLFFDVQNLKDLLILRKYIATDNLSVFLWNPLSSFCRSVLTRNTYSYRLRRSGYRIYTFDRADASRYGFVLTNQVYRPAETVNAVCGGGKIADYQCDIDLFFVGKDKQRLPVLAKINSMALLSHLNCKFHLVRDKHTSSSYGALQGSVTDDTLSYEETLHWIGRSKCLVEILQEGQSGSSLRTLEALFYGKKLLTNNRTIVSEPYYDQQRVFILDRDNPADLRAFIDRPLDLEENARYWCRSIYHIDQWLEHFRRME